MHDIKINTISFDEFVVMDEDDSPVTGLIDGDFTKELFNPDNDEVANISAGIPVTIVEVGNGLYRISFTPDKLGNWVLLIYNNTYFPWGKGNDYKCVEYSSDTIGELLTRVLGLSLENYRMISPRYDRNNNLIAGIIKIYPSANDVDTDTNSIAEYEINAHFDLRTNLMTDYKVKKKS